MTRSDLVYAGVRVLGLWMAVTGLVQVPAVVFGFAMDSGDGRIPFFFLWSTLAGPAAGIFLFVGAERIASWTRDPERD